jgi:Arc/MetJ family transcription regulator
LHIFSSLFFFIRQAAGMGIRRNSVFILETAATKTTIRLDTRLADEAVKVLGVKSRTEAAGVALREIVSLKRLEA